MGANKSISRREKRYIRERLYEDIDISVKDISIELGRDYSSIRNLIVRMGYTKVWVSDDEIELLEENRERKNLI